MKSMLLAPIESAQLHQDLDFLWDGEPTSIRRAWWSVPQSHSTHLRTHSLIYPESLAINYRTHAQYWMRQRRS